MTSGNKVNHGLHVVKKTLKAGVRWYVYAWRGGPCIHEQDGRRPTITRDLILKAGAVKVNPKHGLPGLIADYRASPEFTKNAPDTQSDYRRSLDRIEAKFGKAPLEVFNDYRMRGKVIAFRDEWQHQPRTADKLTVMFGTLLAWATERGRLKVNIASAIPLLHSADHSEDIWQDSDWEAISATASKELMTALRLASLTGLRLGDLVRLDWTHVKDKAIVMVTAKRKKRVVIPILPELRALLDSIPGEGAVLKNSRGKAWTSSGLGSVYQKAKGDLTVRIHDLRGTYVTWLCTKGLTDEEIHRIIGWSLGRINDMRARYVDEARVVVSLVERLSA